MKKEEKEQFDELYQYVKFNILQYDKNIRVPQYFILRLKGLAQGKFISNKKTKSMGKYTFKEILYTFKFASIKIKKTISNKSRFKDEQHLTNTIMMIVEREINNVVYRLRNIKKTEEKVGDFEIFVRSEDIQYLKFKDNKSNIFKNKIKGLW
jgi:hypothetical protein